MQSLLQIEVPEGVCTPTDYQWVSHQLRSDFEQGNVSVFQYGNYSRICTQEGPCLPEVLETTSHQLSMCNIVGTGNIWGTNTMIYNRNTFHRFFFLLLIKDLCLSFVTAFSPFEQNVPDRQQDTIQEVEQSQKGLVLQHLVHKSLTGPPAPVLLYSNCHL